MLQVYFSHVGEIPLTGATTPEIVNPGKLREILAEIETRHPGLCGKILDSSSERLNSATLVFKRIEVNSEGRLLEGDCTKPVKDLDEVISDKDENLLIALFHPEQLVAFLLETLTSTHDRFEYAGSGKEYRAYISAPNDNKGGQQLFVEAKPEPLYPFTNARPIEELVTDNLIDVDRGKLIPTALRNAIAK